MYDGFNAEVAETSMTMYNFDLLADDDIPKYGEEGENGRERRFAVYDKEGDVVDFETIGKVPHACATGVGMRYNDDFVAAVDEFLQIVRSIKLWRAG